MLQWDYSGFYLREWKLSPAQDIIIEPDIHKQDRIKQDRFAYVRPETVMQVTKVERKPPRFLHWLVNNPEEFNKFSARTKLRLRNIVIREDKALAKITTAEEEPQPIEIVYLVKDARARKKNRKAL